MQSGEFELKFTAMKVLPSQSNAAPIVFYVSDQTMDLVWA